MIAPNRRLIAAMHLFAVVVAPMLLGLLVGGPAFVWLLSAVALGLITVSAERRAFRPSAGPGRGAPLASPLPPAEPHRVPESPELPPKFRDEQDERRYLGEAFASPESAILWHLVTHGKDIDKTGPVLAKLEYLVSVLAGGDSWRPPSPWEGRADPGPAMPTFTLADHARELIAGVLPGDDPRRPDLAEMLGGLLGRWSASTELGEQVRRLYPREPASRPPEDSATAA